MGGRVLCMGDCKMGNQCLLRLATYNIWNNEEQCKREKQILQEIHLTEAHVVGLQEVTDTFYENVLAKDKIYPYSCFYTYAGEREGLAILSKFPICEENFLNRNEKYAYSNALNIIVTINNIKISITNVHLPWDSVKKQEEQIVAIDEYIHAQQYVDFYVLLGDFNGNMNSSVNRYLLGDQTINGHESNLYWNDLQSGYCVRKGIALLPTLDFINNLRFAGKETIAVPMVVDRIYVMESWDDVDMNELSIFGTEVYPDIEMSASDHYGIVVELEFAK